MHVKLSLVRRANAAALVRDYYRASCSYGETISSTRRPSGSECASTKLDEIHQASEVVESKASL